MTTRPRPTKKSKGGRVSASPPVYPFAALVGQEEMKLALLLSAVEPSIGGVLIMGHRGTGKSTAVRALADLLPTILKARDCAFNCDPTDAVNLCDDCRARLKTTAKLTAARAQVSVVDLPLGATEDRICGTIDIERALKEGVKSFEPGLLARANRGFLYVDEVNLLEDHLVDLLLDASATGRNIVEREGVSFSHPARFVLIGSGNPEEGDLRPQLEDRFGLFVEIRTDADVEARVRIVERREAFGRDPVAFARAWEKEQASLRRRLVGARRKSPAVEIPRQILRRIAELCARHEVDGHRGELTIARASRALAALEGRKVVGVEDVRRVAALALRHRLRRDPLEQSPGGARLDESVRDLFGETDASAPQDHKAGRGDEYQSASPERHDSDSAAMAALFVTSGDSVEKSRNEVADGRGERSSRDTGAERDAPTIDARLSDGIMSMDFRARGARPGRGESERHSTVARKYVPGRRGRYASATEKRSEGAVVAFDATLRAAVQSLSRRDAESSLRLRSIRADDLRFKRFQRKSGTLYILAVDASGSMALNRIGQAKGALAHLLKKSYVSRDRVALISFRGEGAHILLSPGASTSRAKAALDALRIGGATPLPAALLRTLEIVRRVRLRGAERIKLILFTDGRANVPVVARASESSERARRRVEDEIKKLGREVSRAGVETLVVDTQSSYTSTGEGRALASALGGRYTRLPSQGTGETLADIFGIS